MDAREQPILMMKIFVLGISRSGKTTLAKGIAEELKLPHISSSGWVRTHFAEGAPISDMTAYSQEQLEKNPSACLDYLQANYDLSIPCVIEGIRNPFDFIHLFDPREDLVILLDYVKNLTEATLFESGLEVIDRYVKWLEINQLIRSNRRLKLTFSEFDTLLSRSIAFIRESL